MSKIIFRNVRDRDFEVVLNKDDAEKVLLYAFGLSQKSNE
jgi:hypothetical protein